MKRLTGIVALVVLASVSQAEETFRAEIKEVDAKSKQLKIEARTGPRRGQILTVTTDKRTLIEFGNRRQVGKLEDLAVGRRARFVLVREDDHLIAAQIRVIGRPPTTTEPIPVEESVEGKDGKVIRGLLQRVSYTDREIVLFEDGKEGKENEVIVNVPKDVKVMVDGKTIPYDELKDGQQAAVRVVMNKGRANARLIHVGKGEIPSSQSQMSGMDRVRRAIKITKTAVDFLDRLLNR